MKTYRMTGVPAGAPVPILLDRQVGEEFQADLDKDEERALVDAGALEIVKQAVKPAGKDPK